MLHSSDDYVELQSGQRDICPECGEERCYKVYTDRQSHWAHLAHTNCRYTESSLSVDSLHSGESEIHKQSKRLMRRHLNAGRGIEFISRCILCHGIHSQLFFLRSNQKCKEEVRFNLDKNFVIFDIAVVEDEQIICGIEIKHTHSASKKDIRDIISWFEVTAEQIEEKLPCKRLITLTCIKKHKCDGCIINNSSASNTTQTITTTTTSLDSTITTTIPLDSTVNTTIPSNNTITTSIPLDSMITTTTTALNNNIIAPLDNTFLRSINIKYDDNIISVKSLGLKLGLIYYAFSEEYLEAQAAMHKQIQVVYKYIEDVNSVPDNILLWQALRDRQKCLRCECPHRFFSTKKPYCFTCYNMLHNLHIVTIKVLTQDEVDILKVKYAFLDDIPSYDPYFNKSKCCECEVLYDIPTGVFTNGRYRGLGLWWKGAERRLCYECFTQINNNLY